MNSDYVIRIIGICVVVLLLLGWVGSRFITIIGINGETGLSIAKELVANHEDPSRCNTIHLIDFFPTPPEEAHRIDCFNTVAKMMKDPSVCEYLMPSEYGVSCIGAVWSTIDIGDGCASYKSGDLICATGTGSISTKAQTENCNLYNNAEFRDWCHTRRTQIMPGINECDQISPIQTRKDECLHVLAFKEKNMDLCNQIQGKEKRALCQERIKMWQKYPQIRSIL